MTTLSTHKKWHNTIPCDTCKTAEGWWQMWTNLNERKFELIYAHKSTQPIHKMCKTFMRENIHTHIRAPSTFDPIFLFKFKWTPTYTRFACFNGYFFCSFSVYSFYFVMHMIERESDWNRGHGRQYQPIFICVFARYVIILWNQNHSCYTKTYAYDFLFCSKYKKTRNFVKNSAPLSRIFLFKQAFSLWFFVWKK